MRSHHPAWAAHLPPGLRVEDLDLLADGSLIGRWKRRWMERPSWSQLQDVDGRWLTSAEMEEQTRTRAERMRGAGLRPGDRLILCGPTSAQLVVAYVAALRAALVVVPVNPAYTQAEVTRIVDDAKPAGAVVQDSAHGSWIRAACREPIPILSVSPEELGAKTECGGIDDVAVDDPAVLLYTSGTTGRPKGALLSHGNLLASATAVNLAWRWSDDDVLLLTLPLFHLHGLGVGVNGSLCAGGSIVLRPNFDAGDVAQRVRRGISLFFGVPAMYQRLVAAGSASALAALRLLVSGSAPLPAALAREVAAQAGQIPLERYGMTETVMLTSNPYDGERKPGTVGVPLPGVKLRLEADGEVQVAGPNVISGYYRRPEESAASFTTDGWFRTGDLGELDGDGYLRLVGRSKDLIISGGYNVYPREVEEAIATHPAVRDVAVVGRGSEAWGEEVTAVVVADGVIEPQDLRAHARRQLAPYKVPKRIEFVDELPRNAMGKVLRDELRGAPRA